MKDIVAFSEICEFLLVESTMDSGNPINGVRKSVF